MGRLRHAPAKRSPLAMAKAAGAVIAWLAIWQIVAWAIGNPWLLSGPVETLVAWGDLALTQGFWQAVARSSCASRSALPSRS
ncbi:MAG: hypothetical protein V8R08_01105 [Coriobacteriales bacterium]